MKESSNKKYAATQKMRKMETELRKLKDRRMAFSSAGNELEAKRIQRALNLKTKVYKQFCIENGLTPQTERVNVDGYKRISVGNNALTNGKNGNIIEAYKGKPIRVENNAKISPEVISKVEDVVKLVQKDFKHLFEFSEGIAFGDIFDDLGCAKFDVRTGKANIELNINGFANPKNLLEILDNDFKSGKSYDVNGIESLVAHEIGHNIHYALSLKRANISYGKPLDNLTLYLFDNEYKKICQEIYIQYFSNETIEQINELCIKELGYMTKNNPRELIAQSFGNYYFGKEKSKIGKSIVEYFIKEMK